MNPIASFHYDVGFTDTLVADIDAAGLWVRLTTPDANDYKCQQVTISTHPQLRSYDQRLFEIFSEVLRAYNAEWSTPANSDSGYTLLRYRTGDECTLHYDYAPYDIRICTAVLYLNDDYEGGELVFPKQQVSLHPKRGDLVVMPASYLYPHRVAPVTRGERLCVRCFYRLDPAALPAKHGA